VGVVYGRVAPGRIRRIVVPVTGGANSQLAAELAPGFASQLQAGIQALTVVSQDTPEEEVSAIEAEAKRTIMLARLGTDLRVLRTREVGRGLVEALSPDDLVIIGAPRTDPVAALLAETLPGTIGRHAPGPMLVVRDVEAHHTGRFEAFFGGK
jgi:nucleotide-binding universal stress UspA family protein